jgi:hypothetical protein
LLISEISTSAIIDAFNNLADLFYQKTGLTEGFTMICSGIDAFTDFADLMNLRTHDIF